MSTFTALEIAESASHREKLVGQTTFSKRQGTVIPAPAPSWSLDETHALILLIYAGVKFTKAWDQYLQHSLLFRSKGTASGKWYQEKKDISRIDAYHGEKHWLLDGGRLPGESKTPSSEVLVERAIRKLRQVRTMCLNTSPERPKYTSIEEWRADLFRREGFGSSSDRDDCYKEGNEDVDADSDIDGVEVHQGGENEPASNHQNEKRFSDLFEEPAFISKKARVECER